MGFEDRETIPEWLRKSDKGKFDIPISEDGKKLSSKVVKTG